MLEEALDERQAPEIDEVVSGSAHKVYSNAKEFYARTYLSASMKDVLKNIVKVFKGEAGNNTLVLYSLFGGGKTHTLIAIFHAFREPASLSIQDQHLSEEIKKHPALRSVVIFGKNSNFSGSPSHPLTLAPHKVNTVWGYLAHCLGRFEEVRIDDKNLTVPTIDALRRILGSESTIILIDELVDYGVNFLNSKDQTERRYAQNLPLFLDRLATAAIGTKAVIVVTFPIRVGGGKDQIERVEGRYLGQEKYVEAMWDGVRRVGSRIVSPLESAEIVSVLRRRIFSKCDSEEASKLVQDLKLDYEASKEIFGEEAYSLASRIFGNTDQRDTYPYHPLYVDVLRDIVERAGLQRTRDLLRISRIAVRRIWNSETNPALVMPWHVDLTDSQLKNLLLSSSVLKDYAVAVDRDILNNTSKSSKPRLADIVATTIFLKTYIYDTPLPLNQCPLATEVARLTYEPAVFTSEKWKPADIPDVLRELQSILIFLLEKDGRYWFWRIATIKEQIEAEAKRLREGSYKEVLDWLTGFVNDVSWGKLDFAKGRREISARKRSSVFSDIRTTTNLRNVDLPEDGKYKLLIVVSDAVTGEDLKKDDGRAREVVEGTIFRIGEKTRNEKNTVYLLLPSSKEPFQRAVELAARRLACDKVTDEIKTIYKGVAKEVLEVQQGIINRMKDETIRRLGEFILSAYTSLAYPSALNGNESVRIADTPSGTASTSLIDSAESALSQAGFDKLYPTMSFYTLKGDFNTKLGIDLVNGDKGHHVRDIRSYFKTNPRLPIVEDEIVASALREGIKGLEIGLVSHDKTYYKMIHSESPNESPYVSDTEGEVPPRIDQDSIVMPWRLALDKQTVELITRSGLRREGERAYKEWFEVLYRGKKYDLRELVTERDWYEIGKLGFIARRVDEVREKFVVTLRPTSRTVRPSDPIEVSLQIEPIGKFSNKVTLNSETGTLTVSQGTPPFESTWRLNAPSAPGEHRIVLTGKADDPRNSTETATLVLLIERNLLEIPEIGNEQIGHLILGVDGIREMSDLSVLERAFGGRKIDANIVGKVTVQKLGATVEIDFANVDLQVAKQLSEDAVAYLEGTVKGLDLNAAIRPEAPIDDSLARELARLNGRVRSFKVKRGLA